MVLGFTYALPNLYPTQPSIQVAYTDSGKSADQILLNELQDILDDNEINPNEIFLRDNKIILDIPISKLRIKFNNYSKYQQYKQMKSIKKSYYT